MAFDDLSQYAQKSMSNYMESKAAQTLIGICSGLVADAQLNEKEILFLRTWLSNHESLTNSWPGKAIAMRIDEIMSDGIITEDEKQDLVQLLTDISGNNFTTTGSATPDTPALPIDDDPSIYFRDMLFCFTGEFMYGTRSHCERAILRLGSMPIDSVTKKLNYLVIGSRINPMWKNTTYGRKIEKAVEYRDSGVDLCIISEQQWLQAIADAARK